MPASLSSPRQWLERLKARATELLEGSLSTDDPAFDDFKIEVLDCLKLIGPLADRAYEEAKELNFHPPMPAGPSRGTLLSAHYEKTVNRLKALLDLVERILPAPGQAASSDSTTEKTGDHKLSDRERNGKFCQQVIEEVRRIRHMCTERGMSVAQIRAQHPEFVVWALVDLSGSEERETFAHPRQWGPVVGHATCMLATHYGKSPRTITDWVKLYRKSVRSTK